MLKRALLVIAAAAMTASTIATAQPAPSGEPILVGASASLSGRYKSAGTSLLNGYRAWVEHMNRSGGLLGRPVKLVYYDDQSEQATAVRLYRKLVTEDKVNVALGPYGSGPTFAVSAVTEEYKVPLVATAAGAANIFQRGLQYVFQGEPGSAYLAEPPLSAARERGLTKVAVLYSDNAWGKDFFESTKTLAKQAGLEIVHSQSYPADVKDLSSALLQARARGAEVITSSAYLPDAELIARQLKDMRWAPKLVFLATAFDRNFGAELKQDAAAITTYAMWSSALQSHENTGFQKLYKELFGTEADDKAAIGYAAGQVVEAAVKATGGLASERLRDFIATHEIPTVLAGIFKVDPTGLQVGYKVLLMQWQNNELRIMGPKELAEAPLVFPFPDWSGR